MVNHAIVKPLEIIVKTIRTEGIDFDGRVSIVVELAKKLGISNGYMTASFLKELRDEVQP